jgi:hypothetical protein
MANYGGKRLYSAALYGVAQSSMRVNSTQLLLPGM